MCTRLTRQVSAQKSGTCWSAGNSHRCVQDKNGGSVLKSHEPVDQQEILIAVYKIKKAGQCSKVMNPLISRKFLSLCTRTKKGKSLPKNLEPTDQWKFSSLYKRLKRQVIAQTSGEFRSTGSSHHFIYQGWEQVRPKQEGNCLSEWKSHPCNSLKAWNILLKECANRRETLHTVRNYRLPSRRRWTELRPIVDLFRFPIVLLQ